jgi:hypothetical protein
VKEGEMTEKLRNIESYVELAIRQLRGESGKFSLADYDELSSHLLELQMDSTITHNADLLCKCVLKLAELVRRLALACLPGG